MTDQYSKIVYHGLNEKTTEELTEIWVTNDQIAWTATAFDVIQEILLERLGELPERPPVIEIEPEEEDEDEGEQTYEAEFTRLLAQTSPKEDSPIKDNQPVFYSPTQVHWLSKWLPRAGIASVFLSLISGFMITVSIIKIFTSLNPSDPTITLWSWILAITTFIISTVLSIIISYLPLRALGHILKILMEMEFNSRSAKT